EREADASRRTICNSDRAPALQSLRHRLDLAGPIQRLECRISRKHAGRATASTQTCSNATRRLEDRPGGNPGLPALLASVGDDGRKGCRRGSANVDASNLSIPPCCPASGREIHVEGQKTRRGKTNRHYVAPGFATRVQALRKPKPGESTHRCAHREIC